MDEPAANGTSELRYYLHILRARKWTLLISIGLALTWASLWSYQQTPMYTSEARVFVEPLSLDTGSSSSIPLNVEAQAQLVASQPVASMVLEDLESAQSIPSLLDGLDVQGTTQEQLLVIRYTSPDPVFARDASNHFAQNYLEHRKTRALEELLADEQLVRRQVTATSEQLARVTEQIQNLGDTADESLLGELENQRNLLSAKLGVLQQELEAVAATRRAPVGGGEVIASAIVPESPSSPGPQTILLLGLVAGLAVGIAAAFLRDRLDDRFRGRGDVEGVLGAPVLAAVPNFRGARKNHADALVALNHRSASAGEAYRSLRTNLQFITTVKEIRSVLVTSPSAGEGKTATTANLAVVLAQAGRRVIVISADLRRPTLETYFGVESRNGLSELLASSIEYKSFIKDPGVPNLRLITSGTAPPNPAELLTSPRLGALVQALEDECDLVLFDSPPILAVTDAGIIAAQVGGTILVTDSDTHRSAATQAREEVERAGGVIIGGVVNRSDRFSSPYSYYGHYRGYYPARAASPPAG